MTLTGTPQVKLDGDTLVIGRTRVARSEVQRVESGRRGPKIKSRLSAIAIGAGGIPLVAFINALSPEDLAWLFFLPIALVVGGGFSLMTSSDRYAVVLVTAAGAVDAYVHSDSARVNALTLEAQALLTPAEGSPA